MSYQRYYGQEEAIDYMSHTVDTETFQHVAGTITRKYTTDGLGRVTEIDDATFGNRTYAYDDLGRVVNDNGSSVSYDSNGNIQTLGGKTFYYDSTVKNKLMSVNGTTVYYHSTNPWLIQSFESKTYAYQGNKLTQFTNGSSTYNYTYNHLGLRVTKPNVQFIYDGDKLITEVGPYYKLDFLYDENNQLYGFVKDNTAKYFYIRDILGNILGIINSLGVVVSKYSYTAYGTPTITLDTDSIGSLNPFRFKGYYYDTESQMYYCNARYYVPAWGRWLTPDSADYLQYDSITGFNTFAYCNNNPVMYADPSGHMAFGLAALAAITIASMLIGGAAQLISNALAGQTGDELWRGVAGAALGAGVNALALCLAMPTGGASFAIAAAANSIVQTGVDALESTIRKEKVDSQQFFADLGTNFATTLIGNWLGGNLVPTNSGWFKPQKFMSVFTKSYGQKLLGQSLIGGIVSGSVNYDKKDDSNSQLLIPGLSAIGIYI